MDNKDKLETIRPDDDLLIVELDDRLEFSAIPVDIVDLQVDCTNGKACDPSGNSSGCQNTTACGAEVAN